MRFQKSERNPSQSKNQSQRTMVVIRINASVIDFESPAIREAGVALGERLVCTNHLVGTGKGSGVRTEIRYASTYRFADDGRIVEIHEYATLDEALEAAGLRE